MREALPFPALPLLFCQRRMPLLAVAGGERGTAPTCEPAGVRTETDTSALRCRSRCQGHPRRAVAKRGLCGQELEEFTCTRPFGFFERVGRRGERVGRVRTVVTCDNETLKSASEKLTKTFGRQVDPMP